MRTALLSLAALSLACAGADPAQAQTQAGRLNPAGRDIALGGPLKDGDFILGEIDYVLTADDRILVDTQGLLLILNSRLAPADHDRLRFAIGDRERISQEELRTLGLEVAYEPSTFGLNLQIDPALRPRQIISLGGAPSTAAAVTVQPAGVSAYVTAYAVADYVHRSQGVETGFATPSVLLDSAVRFNGVVLENEATLNDRFAREGTRLVYDDLARTARYTAGDLRPVSRGFAGAAPLAGLSVVRTYADLDPQLNVQPRGQRSFSLDRPSTVEAFVNGRSVQQTRLGPGTYDIRDFPFAQGSNDVRLVIRDDAGRETVLSFSISFDRTLLAPGLTEFGLFGGVRSNFTNGGLRYEDDLTASGFYRRGFTETLTAGANFQAGERGLVLGGETAWATPLGVFGADLAVSTVSGVGEGYALNLGYDRVFEAFRGKPGAVTATLQTTSAHFATPETLTAFNRFAFEAGVSLSQSLGPRTFVSADAFHSVGRGATPDQSTVRAGLGWRYSPRLLWTAEASYEDRLDRQAYGVRVGVSYRFSPFSSGFAEADTRRERARVGYQTSRGRGVGAWNASADIEATPDAAGLNAAVSSTRNRAEVGLSHQTLFNPDTSSISDQRTALRAGASLAFADGRFAVSRPINDSFAMLAPHRSLDSAQVYADPQDRFYSARSGWFGPAVVADLGAYSPRTVTFDVPEAPPGYDLGAGVAQMQPPYRGGYLIEVGSDYSISATGQLMTASGAPLALWVGEAREVDGDARPAVRLFTNASGRFAVQGLRPGRWILSSPDGLGVVYILDIPADAGNLVRAGALNPETRP